MPPDNAIDVSRYEEALIAADAAGDTEAATYLAGQLRAALDSPSTPSRRTPLFDEGSAIQGALDVSDPMSPRFGAKIGPAEIEVDLGNLGNASARGVAQGLGGIADIPNIPVNAVRAYMDLPPLSATATIESLMNEIGLSTDAKPGVGASIMREGSAAIAGSGTLGLLGKLNTGVRMLSDIASNYRSVALASLGLSIPSGVTAKYSGDISENMGAGRDVGEGIGALAGGTVVPFAAVKTVSTARNAMTRGTELFGLSQASRERAAARTLAEAASNKSSIAKIEAGDYDVPGYGKPGTGELLDDPGLIAKKRTIQRSGDLPSGRSQEIANIQRDDLLSGLKTLKPSDDGQAIEPTKDLFRARIARAVDAIDHRVAVAQKNVNQATERLGVKADIDDIQASAKMEFSAALKAARAEESRLWNELGGSYDASEAGAIAKSWIDETGDLMPAVKPVAQYMEKNLSGAKDIKDILKVRSQMNKVASNMSASGDFENARIIRQLSDNILDTIKPLSSDASLGAVDEARKFSRQLNQTFRDGPVGQVLGYTRYGNPKVNPELALENMNLGSAKGAVALKTFKESLAGMRGQSGSGVGDENIARLDDTVQDFLKVKFAASGNKSAFIKKHSDVLKQYPDLKAQMEDASGAEEIYASVSKAAVTRIKNVESQSVASKFIGRELSDDAGGIFSSANKSPTQTAKTLKAMAVKDKTGTAMRGVRSAVYDRMYNDVVFRGKNGEPNIDATKLRNFLGRYSGVVRELHGEPGLRVLREVLKGAEMNARLSKGVAQGGGPETAQRMAGNIKSVVGSIGVVIGARLHKVLNLNVHNLMFAQMSRRYAETFTSKIFEAELETVHTLVERALVDPEFATALMRVRPQTPYSQVPAHIREALAIQGSLSAMEAASSNP